MSRVSLDVAVTQVTAVSVRLSAEWAIALQAATGNRSAILDGAHSGLTPHIVP